MQLIYFKYLNSFDIIYRIVSAQIQAFRLAEKPEIKKILIDQ